MVRHDCSSGSGFATPDLTDQPQCLAAIDIKINPINGLYIALNFSGIGLIGWKMDL